MALLTLLYEYTSTFTQTGLKNKIQIQNHEKLLNNMENLLLLSLPSQSLLAAIQSLQSTVNKLQV